MKGESLQGGNAAGLRGRRVGAPEILRPAAVPEGKDDILTVVRQFKTIVNPVVLQRLYMAF